MKAVHIPEQRPSMDTASIIGLIIWFACVLYSSIRSSSNAQAARYFVLIYKRFCMLSLIKVKVENWKWTRRNPLELGKWSWKHITLLSVLTILVFMLQLFEAQNVNELPRPWFCCQVQSWYGYLYTWIDSFNFGTKQKLCPKNLCPGFSCLRNHIS